MLEKMRIERPLERFLMTMILLLEWTMMVMVMMVTVMMGMRMLVKLGNLDRGS